VNQPLISILTPSFNQAKYLEQTILSVFSQDYPAIEYLIIDGGSTDGSIEIIKKYSDRIAWWISEKDNGQAEAVNKGLKQAKGKYIGWLNSDDFYLPGAISQAVELLETNPKAAFVFGNVKSIDENGKVTNIMRYDHWKFSDLMHFNIIGQPGVFIRKENMDRVGGLDLNYHFLLDHHLWLRLAAGSDVVYSDKIWAAARFHPNAKNVALAPEFGKEAIRLAKWMEGSSIFSDLWIENKNKVWAGAYRIKARYLLDAGKNWDSIVAYLQGFRFSPGTILPESHRFFYALLSLLGFSFLKKLYLKIRFLVSRPDRQRE
jgi:glycosyltransferase involved in cell wall biosynthesis